jgi:hypothetical protein
MIYDLEITKDGDISDLLAALFGAKLSGMTTI